ncbi:MAG: DNA polymerase [Planctomycetota bacterium]|nr:MAG: DNA polymerase [Planctomycetota bacterium]
MSLTTLFMDFNAYFASVEQQLQPELRHQPVAVVAVNTDSTCCIAVSYEARYFDIKTGTHVGRARKMCPKLRIVEARPAVYVRYHHAIVETVESCLPVEAVHSIDEISCRLLGTEQEPGRAVDIAYQIKQALRERIGKFIRCSIGLGPNRFLAKVATKMQKPDGLVVITPEELPNKLYSLALDDLPGIGSQMLKRLNRHGVTTVQQLCEQSEKRLVEIWHSVLGELWWHWLRGHDLPESPTCRRTVGHSHVLPPGLRNDADARAVMVRLIHKAAARMRDLNYWARKLLVHVSFLPRGSWTDQAPLGLCQDTLTMLEAFGKLWVERPEGTPLQVGVMLCELIPGCSATGPLFPAEQNRIQLAHAVDDLNAKFGSHTVYFGGMHGAQGTAPMRISYTSIPDPDFPA